MRRILLATVAISMISSPALALRVTNLDSVPHTIVYVAAGQAYERTIAPNGTTRFDGLPNGRLTLASSPNPKHGGAVEGTGIITRSIGKGRDQGLPVDMADDYVIWKGGDLQIQRRMKSMYGGY